MLTIDLPLNHLRRGAIASLLNQGGAVIESYPHGDAVETIAFVGGVPMPMRLLIVMMVCRWAPPLDHKQSVTKEAISLSAPWLTTQLTKVGFPASIRRLESFSEELWLSNPHLPVRFVIEDMHQHILRGPDPPKTFADIIRKIDEDYEMSLIDPLPV